MGFQGDFLEKVALVLRLKIDAIVYLEKYRENIGRISSNMSFFIENVMGFIVDGAQLR